MKVANKFIKDLLIISIKSQREKNLSACPSAAQKREHIAPEEQSVFSIPITVSGNYSSLGKNQEHLFCFHPLYAVVVNVAI